MRTFRFLLALLTSLTLSLSACGGQQESHEDMTAPVEASEVVFEPGAWMDMTLTDARTKAEFKLSDYRGKVIILEMMDPGCPICKDQLKEIKAALDVVGDKAVAVSVDVGYKSVEAQIYWADKNGATWTLGRMTKEFGNSLVADFGGKIVYPGNTPVVIINTAGEAHATDPGIKTSVTLIELVNQWFQ